METEEQTKKRLGRYYIHICDGCAPIVSQAIKEFRERWKPYSASSRQYPIVRLIEERIDPAVAAYMTTLPQRYLGHVPGAGTGVNLSGIIRLVGLDSMVRVQRELLRKFIKTENKWTARDQRFLATLESLIGLVWDCACKRPARSKIPGEHQLLLLPFGNAQRRQGFCRFCGALTELASFIEHGNWPQGNQEKLRLSHRYCAEHRPMLSDGTQNPAYRRAMRSANHFDVELLRLSKQSAKPDKLRADSGDRAVDHYIQGHVVQRSLQAVDKAELRNQARQMADKRLTDRKKAIMMMIASGQNKKQIAEALGISRQAIYKALATIPKDFRLDEVP
jgi:DNA-binding CsgD family transcriptional regulator